MARRNTEREVDFPTNHPISRAVGAAETLTVGMVHLAERTLVQALHVAEDVGNEIGSTLVRAARGSIQAAGEIGGDLAQLGRNVSRGIVASGPQRAASQVDSEPRKPPTKAGGTKPRRRTKTA